MDNHLTNMDGIDGDEKKVVIALAKAIKNLLDFGEKNGKPEKVIMMFEQEDGYEYRAIIDRHKVKTEIDQIIEKAISDQPKPWSKLNFITIKKQTK